MNGRSVFVTGGTGYLGGALLPVLLSRGHEVRVLADRARNGRFPRAARSSPAIP
jgi:uncharacterized protein YbjT (DUF2867 family)